MPILFQRASGHNLINFMTEPECFYDPSKIRALFTKAMSEMYREEVPLYQTLLDTVAEVNEVTINENPSIENEVLDLARIGEEKHGAIRLGCKTELFNMRRLFAVMGMKPVGYYDLSIADLPIHSTVFRPSSREELGKSPFRIFTSLLRQELLPEDLQDKAKSALSQRKIFSDRCLTLIQLNEDQGGLKEDEALEFIKEAIETFRWHNQATIAKEFYKELLNLNSLVADIIGFHGPHINHLTPRVLDIDLLYKKMQEQDIKMTPTVQGPPKRSIPILLRQTSFRALSEEIFFPNQDGSRVQGTHRARFGEIETRGAALTAKGMDLYNQLLDMTLSQVNQENDKYIETLENNFKAFPDELPELLRQNLIHFNFSLTDKALELALEEKKELQAILTETLSKIQEDTDSAIKLLEKGLIKIIPITFEDFLPISAAGIFKSNIIEGGYIKTPDEIELSNQKDLENALGINVLNYQELYIKETKNSLKQCLEKLKI